MDSIPSAGTGTSSTMNVNGKTFRVSGFSTSNVDLGASISWSLNGDLPTAAPWDGDDEGSALRNGGNMGYISSMGFSESIKTCFKKYADFSGTASRSEYWWFALFGVLVYLCLVIISAASRTPLFIILGLGLLLPSLAVQVRRLRDGGFSGWLALINLIPYLSLIHI